MARGFSGRAAGGACRYSVPWKSGNTGREDGHQSRQVMALSATSPSAAAFPALILYNGILGGFPHSKLYQQVRENTAWPTMSAPAWTASWGCNLSAPASTLQLLADTTGIIQEQLEAMRRAPSACRSWNGPVPASRPPAPDVRRPGRTGGPGGNGRISGRRWTIPASSKRWTAWELTMAAVARECTCRRPTSCPAEVSEVEIRLNQLSSPGGKGTIAAWTTVRPASYPAGFQAQVCRAGHPLRGHPPQRYRRRPGF